MFKNLVIVESPAKWKTIEKFLWKDYRVEASFGHIRDLPKKNIGVDIPAGFVPEYEISPDKKKRVSELKKLAKSAEKIWIATDEDREWEAIGWHLCQALWLDENSVDRIVFHEITKTAIQKAIQNPRKIFTNLVNAQQSRRILDRIVGYEVSPVLWKKIKPWLSAGRVQSVAVKLLVEREREIRAFNPEESWKIVANLAYDIPFSVELVKYNNKKVTIKNIDSVKKFLALHSEKQELSTQQDKKWNLYFSIPHLEKFLLKKSEKKSSKRTPGAPFTTSTLQQEASRKLWYGVKTTMDIAQRLYQNGHITYMRTDSVNLSDLAINTARDFIVKIFGQEYSMPNGRKYKTKQASAQEAHEAIRPTYIDNTPDKINLDGMDLKLYKLIWERTVASQMKEADIETTTYHFCSENDKEDWIAKWEVIKFPGFMKLYIEWTDDENDENESKKLPDIPDWTTINSESLVGQQKFSLPPARYTEASLVKKLEHEGIGRPSTYAPTIATIQERWYVVLESKKLIPTDIAFVVTDYLEQEFNHMMQYSFTAEVEWQFDQIADWQLQWQEMLQNFYSPFHDSVNSAMWTEGKFSGERILWKDEQTWHTILARMSRFGPVIQIGTTEELNEWEKPKYANLVPGMSIDDITLDEAIKLFSFPKNLWKYEDKEVVVAQWRFGPYIKFGEVYVSIPKWEDPQTIDYDRAVVLIEEKKILDAPLGYYQDEPYTKWKWRFGPFLKWKNLYISIPRAIDPEEITPQQAEKLIEEKIQKEQNRYIHNWEEDKISVENWRYGPYIKFWKKNFYLKKDWQKITDLDLIKKLTLNDVKEIILQQDADAFGKPKKSTKKTTAKSTQKSSEKSKSRKSKK